MQQQTAENFDQQPHNIGQNGLTRRQRISHSFSSCCWICLAGLLICLHAMPTWAQKTSGLSENSTPAPVVAQSAIQPSSPNRRTAKDASSPTQEEKEEEETSQIEENSPSSIKFSLPKQHREIPKNIPLTVSEKPVRMLLPHQAIILKTENWHVLLETAGVFVSTEFDEIRLDLQEWTSLKVEQAVPHGTQVMEGDPLLVLETEELEKAIEHQEQTIATATLTLREATDKLRFLKESTAMDLDQSERNAQIAQEDLDYYLNVGENRQLQSAEFALKMAQFRLDQAEEERDQLQQKYEADELSEERDEISLKQAELAVERAQQALKEAALTSQWQLETLFPREKQTLKDAQARTALTQAQNVVQLPLQLRKQELEVEQLQESLRDQKEKLSGLQKDLEQMTVYSPRSGFVYYGQAAQGKWEEIDLLTDQLQPGGTISENQVLMTVVDPEKLQVATSFTETQLAQVKLGLEGVVVPRSLQNVRLPARLKELTMTPAANRKFPALLNPQQPDDQLSLMPGMTCQIKLRVHHNSEALLVPEQVVHWEEYSTPPTAFVWRIHLKSGQAEKQPVSLGFSNGNQVEITQGLAVGDLILRQPPQNIDSVYHIDPRVFGNF